MKNQFAQRIWESIPPIKRRWYSQSFDRYYRMPRYNPRAYVLLKKAVKAMMVLLFMVGNLSVSEPVFKPYDLHSFHGGEVVIAVGYRSLCLYPSGWVRCSPTEEVVYQIGDTIVQLK